MLQGCHLQKASNYRILHSPKSEYRLPPSTRSQLKFLSLTPIFPALSDNLYGLELENHTLVHDSSCGAAAASGKETCVRKGAWIAGGTGGRENWTERGPDSAHNLCHKHSTTGRARPPTTIVRRNSSYVRSGPPTTYAWLYFENTNILIILWTMLGPEHKLVCGRTPLFLHTAKNVQGKHTHGDQILARKLENGRQIKCNQTWDQNIDLTQVFWSDCKSKLSSKMQSEHRFVH
jgi:hypothetical protein